MTKHQKDDVILDLHKLFFYIKEKYLQLCFFFYVLIHWLNHSYIFLRILAMISARNISDILHSEKTIFSRENPVIFLSINCSLSKFTQEFHCSFDEDFVKSLFFYDNSQHQIFRKYHFWPMVYQPQLFFIEK